MLQGKTKPLELPPIRKMLDQAEEIQRLLASSEETSRSKLAQELQLTKPRVTQLMKLLDLHPQIRAYIKRLPPGTPERFVTERGLRTLVNKPLDKQLELAGGVVPGFEVFVEHEARRERSDALRPMSEAALLPPA